METSGGECVLSSREAAEPPALSVSRLRHITSCSNETEGVMRRKCSLPGVRFQYLRLYYGAVKRYIGGLYSAIRTEMERNSIALSVNRNLCSIT